MEMHITYYVVELTTANPSVDATWNFRSGAQAEAYAEEKRKTSRKHPDFYGHDPHVRVYTQTITFCDD